jgi:hypothetical protein
VGLPTVCSETCVGRLRYIGLFLYDAGRVGAAASVDDPNVIAAARRDGIIEEWLDAGRRSPVYALAKKYRVALPLHPLSPVVDRLVETGHDSEDAGNLFGAIDALRSPSSTWIAPAHAVLDGESRMPAAVSAKSRRPTTGRRSNTAEGVTYPAVLLDAGDTDPRCPPWHARKLAAQLQAATAGPAPVLLRIWRDVGLGWATDKDIALTENTEWLAFAMEQLGLLP